MLYNLVALFRQHRVQSSQGFVTSVSQSNIPSSESIIHCTQIQGANSSVGNLLGSGVCLCVYVSWHLWVIQDGLCFAKWSFFLTSLGKQSMFKKQQWPTQIPIEMTQGVLWLSFNHKVWDPLRHKHPWMLNQKMLRDSSVNLYFDFYTCRCPFSLKTTKTKQPPWTLEFQYVKHIKLF